MKSDVIQYERIYNLLRNKIERGIIPVGARLPGRSVLCKELGTSERTIRHALALLQQDGYIEISARKRPVVISAFPLPDDGSGAGTKVADAAQANDWLKTGILLCFPIIRRGMSLCSGDDWRTPETLLAQMDPEEPIAFWQLSDRLWRFFIARNENELLLRAVDGLGFREKNRPPDTYADRVQYLEAIHKLLEHIKEGGLPGEADFRKIFSRYQITVEQADDRRFWQRVSKSPVLAKASGLAQQLSLAQERYSSVCLDLLGLIAMGRYQPGDRLPTHDELQKIYEVSRDTTVKAVRMLQDWGVVTAAPRRGIVVVMDADTLQRIEIPPEAIACHLRRYLDSLDLLALTVEQVALHAASYAQLEDGERLQAAIQRNWEQPHEHQRIPRTLLDFITEHINYAALKDIYRVLARNLSIGRSIPKLVSRDQNELNLHIYQQCMDSCQMLLAGDGEGFAQAVAGMFDQINSLVREQCQQLGYWETAMQVYDGALLWK